MGFSLGCFYCPVHRQRFFPGFGCSCRRYDEPLTPRGRALREFSHRQESPPQEITSDQGLNSDNIGQYTINI